MKMKSWSTWLTLGSAIVLSVLGHPAPSQNQSTPKATATAKTGKYPASFVITKVELDQVLSAATNKPLRLRSNKHLDKLQVLNSTSNGDMRFVRARLSYFRNGYLSVQVNGTASTLVFISSDDKSFFYKGLLSNGRILMTRCEEDEIVSE